MMTGDEMFQVQLEPVVQSLASFEKRLQLILTYLDMAKQTAFVGIVVDQITGKPSFLA